MVDFNKLRNASKKPTVTDPVEIFRRLPKPPGINDLYVSQAQVLTEWFERRNEKDIVIKLHTGGGKTLVGLLIAQSAMHEHSLPVVYLCPNTQLVSQTLEKAASYGISAEPYVSGQDFSSDFYDGKSVVVGTYECLFNGNSRFKLKGQPPIELGAVIVDDAHVALSSIRDQFTMTIEREKFEEDYLHLANVFRHDFELMDLVGSFDDVVSSGDSGVAAATVLEVPYWGWLERITEVRQFLLGISKNFQWEWPFLRDNLAQCHCLISRNAVAITPILPLVDLLPSFADSPRRIYMSATISDDSAVIRAFDAASEAIARPLVSKSLAGVSERLILTPETMPFEGDAKSLAIELIELVREEFSGGSVILVGSGAAAKKWQSVAIYPDKPAKVTEALEALTKGKIETPLVLANRYDGIDLHGNSCRLLIVENKPSGLSIYDLYEAAAFAGGQAVDSELAQRFEQGVGRGARGASDYCVVILLGRALVGWITRKANQKFLTSATRAQFAIGKAVSSDIKTPDELKDTVRRCLDRDRQWVEYHAETLAEKTEAVEIDVESLGTAGAERKAFRLHKAGANEKAINVLRTRAEKEGDPRMRGWLFQLAARFSFAWGNKELSQQLQQEAFAFNDNLLRPQVPPPYVPLIMPGAQVDGIVAGISEYNMRRGYLSSFDDAVSHLVPGATANQFEQALADLGDYLGFKTERPDKKLRIGPDVLWLTGEKNAIIFEAKSRKLPDNPVTKDEHGQLLNAEEWFKVNYDGYSYVRVLVHPNDEFSASVVTKETRIMTLRNASRLVVESRKLLGQICDTLFTGEELKVHAQQLLDKSSLSPEKIQGDYTVEFEALAEK